VRAGVAVERMECGPSELYRPPLIREMHRPWIWALSRQLATNFPAG